MFGWIFLLGWLPSVRGLLTLGVTAAVGAWFGSWAAGPHGASACSALLSCAVIAVAFIRPRVSMWIEAVLYTCRAVMFIAAILAAMLVFSPSGVSLLDRIHSAYGAIYLVIGVAAHLRIRSLVRRGELCPLAIGSTRYS